ncbi:MAG: hypothetical protein EOO20_10620, partial [Chryseobacterium sp.]
MLNRPKNLLAHVTRTTSLILLAAVLSNCGDTSSVKPNVSAPTTKTGALTSADKTSDDDPKELLATAQQKKSPERETLELQAAEIYVAQGKLDRARNIVNRINATQLSDEIFVTHSQIAASIHLKDGEIESARRILTNPRMEQQLNALEPHQEAVLHQLRAETFERSGQFDDSVAERISASALLTDSPAVNSNQEALWQTLMNMPLSNLQANAAKGSGGITQGWYSLAA